MERKIIALIGIDENKVFDTFDDGPVSYLETEMQPLKHKGISLQDCFISDDNEDEPWHAYCNYLVRFAFDNYGEQLEESPMDYYEWYQQEFREAA